MVKKLTALLLTTMLMCTACGTVETTDISDLPAQKEAPAPAPADTDISGLPAQTEAAAAAPVSTDEPPEPADKQASVEASSHDEEVAHAEIVVTAQNMQSASAGFEGEAEALFAQHAIVLDYDRAALTAQPLQADQQIRESGFYYGLSPAKLKKVKSGKLIRGHINKLVTKLKAGTQYYYQPYAVTSAGTIRGELASFTTPGRRTWTAQDAIFENTADRYIYLFGSEAMYYTMDNPPFGYASKTEAASHMTKVSVPVWKLSKGKKSASKMSITVNKKLANNVKAIFAEIYALEMRFPIKALVGYSYRRIVGPGLTGSPIMSHHSFGAAIDINKAYNKFYLEGDLRDPSHPYYIPREVIDIFARYGWAWGGDFKEGFDTMHFQYLGIELTE